MAQESVSIDIRTGQGAAGSAVEFTFAEKYSSSVLNGFHYRNGRQHPEYDYISATLQRVDLPKQLGLMIATSATLEEAFEKTAKWLQEQFELQLATNNSGRNTLNWWHSDHSPSEHVTFRKL